MHYENYAEFVSAHLDTLYRLAYRLTDSRAEAEDLVQNLVIKLQPRFTELCELENPLTWMSKVLYRMFIDYRRHVKRSPVYLISDMNLNESEQDALSSFEQTTDTTLSAIENAELLNQLEIALKQLNEDDRSLIILYEVEGYSINEIHQITAIPEGTIKSRLYRARLRLRSILGNETDINTQACNVVRLLK